MEDLFDFSLTIFLFSRLRVGGLGALKLVFLLGFLYFFICSLSFLSDSFRVLGGKNIGGKYLKNIEGKYLKNIGGKYLKNIGGKYLKNIGGKYLKNIGGKYLNIIFDDNHLTGLLLTNKAYVRITTEP